MKNWCMFFRNAKYAGGVVPESVFHASIDMSDENSLGAIAVSGQRAFEQLLMLPRGDFAAKHHCDHLISKIAVVDQGMGFQQNAGAARRDQGMVEVPVAPLPQLLVQPVPREHAAFHDGELVVGRNNPAFPVEIAELEGL